VSWAAAAFAILGLSLVGGFAWYERSHPSAKVLALVASLAGLAAAGRIAFAALPNVKPTTDIVLIAGFALGGAPGFAVGAVAAVASNFFFGQGPWTPWEMLAWGAVGVGGAVLARATRRQIGRIGLATACLVAGFAHGAIMDFYTLVTAYTRDVTLGRYLAISGSSLPFNVAHAVGNLLFALAFGPALIAMLLRFRSRFEIAWRPATAGAAAATALALLALAAPAALAASRAQYLMSAQNTDGGWGAAPGQSSSQLQTGWAALGLAADGRNPLDVHRAGRTPIDYIRAGVKRLGDVGDLERTILVVRAAGLSARRFAKRDLVAALLRRVHRDGSFDGQVNHTAFGVLALRAAGLPASARPVTRAIAWIAREQNADGGFNFFRRGGQSGIDDTSGAVQALAAVHLGHGRAARRAVTFLRAHQNADGGFPLTPDDSSNSQSTAWAVQGFVATGVNPDDVRRHGRSPFAFLKAMTSTTGSVRYSRSSAQTPVWVTGQALAAVARKPFPLAPVPRRPQAHGTTAGGGAHAAATRAAAKSRAVTTRSPLAQTAKAERVLHTELLTLARQAGVAAGLLLAPAIE
jgi:energy-coupling factor transport system substrate-specific component